MKRGIFTVIIGALLVFVSANCTVASELSEDYFDIAQNYFVTSNYTKALEYIDFILKIEPDNQDANNLRAKILPLCDSAQIQQIEGQQTATILSNTSDAKNFVILNVPQADIEKMSYDSDYFNTKGREFYQKQEYNSAIEYFYKAIKLNSRNAQAYNNLAMAYRMKNNPKIAVKFFKKAYSLNKNYTQPLVNLSIMYRQLGDSTKQLYYLKKAVKVNPNDNWAYYYLADYYKSKNMYPQAIENFKEAIKIDNKFSAAYLGLAVSFFEVEEFNYALATINQYHLLNPTSDYALYLIARTNLVLCRYSEAKVAIEKAIELCDKPEYQWELAKINYYQEDYVLALDIFEKNLKNSSSAEVFNYIGLCNYKMKNVDAAIANFNKAIELDGLRPIYYYNLAQCYKSLGDKKNYAKYVNTATKITPINYQDFIDLSYIYYDNSNPSYAINTLNSAISRYPTVKALYISKLKIFEALGDNLHYNEVRDTINTRFNTK